MESPCLLIPNATDEGRSSNNDASLPSGEHQLTSHVNFSSLTYAGNPDLAISSARQALTGEEGGGGGGEGLPTNSDSELRCVSKKLVIAITATVIDVSLFQTSTDATERIELSLHGSR